MNTKWWCERCGRSGKVEYHKDADVWGVFQKIQSAHDQEADGECLFDRYSVRISLDRKCLT